MQVHVCFGNNVDMTNSISYLTGLLNKATFMKCRKGVHIINVARGGIIDETDLADALKSGQVGGAALDVFVKEPPTDKALLSQENLVVTPHLGASTKEAQRKVAEEIAHQFVAAAEGTVVPGLVCKSYFSYFLVWLL